jgi:hypothetical protein
LHGCPAAVAEVAPSSGCHRYYEVYEGTTEIDFGFIKRRIARLRATSFPTIANMRVSIFREQRDGERPVKSLLNLRDSTEIKLIAGNMPTTAPDQKVRSDPVFLVDPDKYAEFREGERKSRNELVAREQAVGSTQSGDDVQKVDQSNVQDIEANKNITMTEASHAASSSQISEDSADAAGSGAGGAQSSQDTIRLSFGNMSWKHEMDENLTPEERRKNEQRRLQIMRSFEKTLSKAKKTPKATQVHRPTSKNFTLTAPPPPMRKPPVNEKREERRALGMKLGERDDPYSVKRSDEEVSAQLAWLEAEPYRIVGLNDLFDPTTQPVANPVAFQPPRPRTAKAKPAVALAYPGIERYHGSKPRHAVNDKTPRIWNFVYDIVVSRETDTTIRFRLDNDDQSINHLKDYNLTTRLNRNVRFPFSDKVIKKSSEGFSSIQPVAYLELHWPKRNGKVPEPHQFPHIARYARPQDLDPGVWMDRGSILKVHREPEEKEFGMLNLHRDQRKARRIIEDRRRARMRELVVSADEFFICLEVNHATDSDGTTIDWTISIDHQSGRNTIRRADWNGCLQISNDQDGTKDKPRTVIICDNNEDHVKNFWAPLLDSVKQKGSEDLCCVAYEGSINVDKKQMVRTAMQLESDMIKRRRTDRDAASSSASASSVKARPPVPSGGFGFKRDPKSGIETFSLKSNRDRNRAPKEPPKFEALEKTTADEQTTLEQAASSPPKASTPKE